MIDYADLEIGLHRLGGATWRVELRHTPAKSDADVQFDSAGPLVMNLDPDEMAQLGDDEEAYGRALGAALLTGRVESAYRQSTRVAVQSSRLRVRLHIGPDAMELHDVRWETLRDPLDGSRLLANENVVFSRYLSSMDWRPAPIRPMDELSALILVAGGTDVGDYGDARELAPVDVVGEVARATAGLVPLKPTVLIGPDATEEQLFARLHDGCDILYLVCHGYQIRGGDAVLLLEDGNGHAVPLRGSALIERLRGLTRLPRLVVLASCQSGGDPEARHSADGGELSALGPRLAEAGVPAVLAMQGDVSMATIERFMPIFFRELHRDGVIDRATSAARAAVRDHEDWWVPTLFMRLRSGRLWYVPGRGRLGERFDKFPALVNEIRNQRCTPILGPGLSDQLLGSRQKVAQRWARTFHFPMAPHHRDDLPQVAQFLATTLNRRFPRDKLIQHLRSELLESYGSKLPGLDNDNCLHEVHLGQLISGAWRVRHESGAVDPYAVLARMPIPLYLTAQPWNLLAEALRAEQRDPQVEMCQWKRLDDLPYHDDDPDTDSPNWAFQVEHDPVRQAEITDAGWPASVFERDRRYRPSIGHPLVFHLFGHMARPRSLVLTEDDYFDFLISVNQDKDLVPIKVRRSYADSSLMFLGFRLDEWDFRVLFRSILSQEGGYRRGEHTHVAVQIDPEEGRTMEPERARDYLDQYFQHSDITIYWGSAESFVKELSDAWDAEA